MIPPIVETVEFPTDDACPVRGDFYLPRTGGPNAVVILCHGFEGYKDWGFLPYLWECLRDRGIAAISVDFSHNGTFHPPSANGNNRPGGRSTRYFRRKHEW